jgi:GSH-dependent disulfide-bond oxidoreductase
MAAYPWIVPCERQQRNSDDFANLRRWFEATPERPATVLAYVKSEPYSSRPAVTDEGTKILFRQRRRTSRKVR